MTVRYAGPGSVPGSWHVERRTAGGQVQTFCGQWMDGMYARRGTPQPGDPWCRGCADKEEEAGRAAVAKRNHDTWDPAGAEPAQD